MNSLGVMFAHTWKNYGDEYIHYIKFIKWYTIWDLDSVRDCLVQ